MKTSPKQSTTQTVPIHAAAKPNICIASAIAIFSLLAIAPAVKGQAVSLGAAENFTIVSSQGVTNSGLSVITGNVALSPLITITGFSFSTPPGGGVITGSVHYADALAAQAQANALTAYNTLAGLAYIPANNKTGLDLGGMTLAPGVYHFDTSAGLTGNLTLATGADPNAVFIFQIGSTLTAAVGSSITVTGAGAGSDPNVFWQVGSSATLNTGSVFDGNILALASVSFGTGSTLTDGRAIALSGAVSLLGNNLSAPLLPPAAPGRFWNGSANNLWSATNWSSTVAGADHIVLGSGADVVFSVNGPTPTPQNQNTILDFNATISSLTVNDSVSVTIGGSNTLTISATGLTTGININSGAGLTTISSNLVLGNLSRIVTVNNAAGMLISGMVGGTNGLTKSGTGILILTGNGSNSYSGGTTINQGTVAVGGVSTIGSGSTSAMYLGVGNVNLTNNATLETTGAINPAHGATWINIGTTANNANYTQSNGTLVLGLASNNYQNNDFLNITGSANIVTLPGTGPNIVINSYNGFNAALHDQILLGNATAGGFQGRFNESFVDNANGLAGTVMVPHIDYGNVSGNEDPNGITLVYRQDIAFNNIGIILTPNQTAVANTLNNIQTTGDLPINSGPLLALFNVINQTQLQGLPNDYDLIAPEAYAAMPEVALSAIDIHTTNLEHRMFEIRNGVTGFSDSGLSLHDGKGTNSFEMSRNGKGVVDKNPVHPENDNLAFWVAGAGEFTNIGGDNNASGYDLTTGGITLGLDYRMSNSFSLGVMLGYQNTHVSLINDGKIDVDGGKLGLYAIYHENGWYVDAIVNGGCDSYKTSRAALGGFANGSTDGAEFEGYLGGGYDMTQGSWTFGPTAKIEYSYVGINSFTETGSLAPLSIHAQSVNSFVTKLGAHVSYKCQLGGMPLTPDLSVEWNHQCMDKTYGIVSSFSNDLGGPFTVTGPQIGIDSLAVNAGVNLQVTPRTGIFLYYNGQFATRLQANGVNGGVSIKF